MAAVIASPVSPALDIDHLPSLGWSPPCRWRISRLWANPPAEISTPCRARIDTGTPSRTVRTPTTRPPSTIRSSRGASVHTGIPWSTAMASIWPTSDAPFVRSAFRRALATKVRSATRADMAKLLTLRL